MRDKNGRFTKNGVETAKIKGSYEVSPFCKGKPHRRRETITTLESDPKYYAVGKCNHCKNKHFYEREQLENFKSATVIIDQDSIKTVNYVRESKLK